MKTAFLIVSDSRAGTNDANGKPVRGQARTYDFNQAGEVVTVRLSGH